MTTDSIETSEHEAVPLNKPVVDAEIPNRGPRITPDDVEGNIASEHYFTAAQGDLCAQEDASASGSSVIEKDSPLFLLTFCVLVLRNGFTVTGESACAAPENFKADIGKRIARAQAVSKIWPLMGYELRSKLADDGLGENPFGV